MLIVSIPLPVCGLDYVAEEAIVSEDGLGAVDYVLHSSSFEVPANSREQPMN
jgi:hypothetical protein